MQFQTAQFKSAPAVIAARTGQNVHRSSLVAESGQPGYVITPRDGSVNLLLLIVSWNGVELAGELHIGDIIIEQDDAGHLEIPCFEMLVDVTEGLTSECNSVGGNYAITAIFRP